VGEKEREREPGGGGGGGGGVAPAHHRGGCWGRPPPPPPPAKLIAGPGSSHNSDTLSAHPPGAVSGSEFAHAAGVEASNITLSASSFEGCDLPAPAFLDTMSLSRISCRSIHTRISFRSGQHLSSEYCPRLPSLSHLVRKL